MSNEIQDKKCPYCGGTDAVCEEDFKTEYILNRNMTCKSCKKGYKLIYNLKLVGIETEEL